MEYRAISKITNEFVYGTYIKINDFVSGKGKSEHWIVENFNQNGGFVSVGAKCPIYPETICIKSLRNDEKKKWVYSGDIIKAGTVLNFRNGEKIKDVVLMVYWSVMDGFYLYTKDGMRFSFNDVYEIEVIGNKFEKEMEERK